MRKPSESLDDFVVKAQEIDIEPPLTVSLRFTGEVEVLKPLTIWESAAKREAVADSSAPLGFSRFHRSLFAGGAFAIGAVILTSAIFIGMYDSDAAFQKADVSQATDVAIISGESEAPAQPSTADEPKTSDILTDPSSELRDPQSALRTRHVQRSKPRRQPLRSRYVVSDFTPTTLVIYIEKGRIKTRIEPQLNNDKKPLTFSN